MKPRALLALTLAIASGGCWLTASLDAPTDGGLRDGSSARDATTDVVHPRGDASHTDSSSKDVTIDTATDAGTPHDAGHDRSQIGSDSSVTCTNAMTYRESVIAAGAIAYWRLGDPGTMTAVDELGHHDGKYTPGVTFGQQGPIDASVSVKLDGDGGEVLVSSDGGFSEFIGKQPYTLEAWMRPAVVSSLYLGVLSNEVVHDSGGREGYVLFVQIDAGIGLDRYGDSGSTPLRWPGPVSKSGWTHIVGTYDPSGGTGGTGEVRLYVNGINQASAQSGLSIVGGCTFAIGGTHCGTSGFFNGYISEVALYDQVLDAGCITAHYNFGK